MKALGFGMLLCAALLPSAAYATSAQDVRVSQAWLRILPGALPAAGYAVVQNTGSQPIVLTGARSTIYGEVMLHFSSVAGGTSRMRMVDGMPIPAHGMAHLAPGSYHLMLTRALHPVIPGDHVLLTLSFDDGSTLNTTFIARPANAVDAEPDSVTPPATGTTANAALPGTHGAAQDQD